MIYFGWSKMFFLHMFSNGYIIRTSYGYWRVIAGKYLHSVQILEKMGKKLCIQTF